MITVKVDLTAWDKTLETRDFGHLYVFYLTISNLKIRQEK